MAKLKPHPAPRKRKSRALTREQLDRRQRWVRRLVNVLGIVAVVGGFGLGYRALAAHVRQNHTIVERPPALVLVNRPSWLNDRLAGEIAARLAKALPAQSSTLDVSLLEKLNEILARDAWIEQVHAIRRTRVGGRDSILIDCAYRMPLAIARFERGRDTVFQLIDANGVLLPIRYEPAEAGAILAGQDRSTNLRIIAGLAGQPPATGSRWESRNLKAGLEVAALIHDEAAARDIAMIDVSNVGSPSAPQVILWTTSGTQIRWGQPPGSTDLLVEATPQAKLAHLRTVESTFAGEYPEWVDIRFDAVKYHKLPSSGQ